MDLLQTHYDFFSKSNSSVSYIALVVFGGLVVIAIVGSVIGNRRRSSGKHFGHASFKRKAKHSGLLPVHIRALEQMIKSQRLQNPLKLLDGGQYLSQAIRVQLETVAADQVSQSVTEARKNVLLQIKAILDASRTNLTAISSSRNIRLGQEVKIVFEHGGGSYETAVISNLANVLGLEIPENDEGVVRPERGVRVQITFLRDGGRVYRFISRVRGTQIVRGKGTLYIDHISNIRQIQKRKSRRREFGRPAYYFPVQIVETGNGRKRSRRAVVQKNQNHLGRIEDISTGGCLLRAQRPLKKGNLIRVDFQSDSGKSISVFGKVCGVELREPYGGDMHIMFTRVSQAHMNEIMSYVYGFSE